MRLFNVHKHNQGFTVIETLIVLLIIGILSAISAPSFLDLLNRSKVNDAVAKVQGALQEAHREAIRKSKSCNVTIDTVKNEITGSCLVTGPRTLPKGVAMATNVSGSIQFGMRGNTTFTSSAGTGNIILYQSNNSSSGIKCVAISKGIGILRSGNYPDFKFIKPPTDKCNQNE